jgi:hypothetical protein
MLAQFTSIVATLRTLSAVHHRASGGVRVDSLFPYVNMEIYEDFLGKALSEYMKNCGLQPPVGPPA